MIDRRIIKLIESHHLMTVATSADNEPWCASCFYTFLEDEKMLVFTTSPDTRHGREFLRNNRVAGTIALETKIIGRIRGIQFTGIVSEPDGLLLDKARNAYVRRFPVAALMDTHLWILTLHYIKLTDNRLGFGKKLIWERSE